MLLSPPHPRRDAGWLASLRGYVMVWALAGVVSVGVVVLLVDPDGISVTPAMLVLLALTAASEAISVNLKSGDSGVTLSLLEAAVVLDILLLGPAEGVVVVVGAIALQHLLRRLAPMKILFNLGEHAVGVSLAATIVALAPGPGPIGLGRVLAVLLAVPLYRLISTRALAGVFARIDAETLQDKMQSRWLELAATALGNASLGILAAALWTSHPDLVWIVAAPAAALFMSYGASYRIEGLFGQVRA